MELVTMVRPIRMLWLITMLPFGYAATCPSGCTCQKIRGNQLSAECSWPNLEPQNLNKLPEKDTISLTVHCTNHGLPSSYGNSLFRRLTKLRRLTLEGCWPKPAIMPVNAFTGLHNLESLVMDRCGHPVRGLIFDENTLDPLIGLDNLRIVGSKLGYLPAKSLCKLKELKSLNLTDNLLKRVDHAGISDCDIPLVVLDLSMNRITLIHEGDFAKLGNLRLLYLSNNVIRDLFEVSAFDGLSNLRSLDLSRNRLRNFKQDLPTSLPQLRSLDLSWNHINDLTPDLALIPKLLVRANLSHNDANFRAGNFHLNASALAELDLSFNKIDRLSNDFISDASKLVKLHLQNNRFEELDLDSLSKAPELAYLDLRSNRIAQARVSMQQLPQLQTLLLSENRLQGAEFLEQVPGLNRLDLAKNNYKIIPSSLDSVRASIQVLNLEQNQITVIHKFFLNRFTALRQLNLSYNFVSEVERYTLEEIPKLKSLDLSHNRISLLGINCFQGSASLSNIFLQGNEITKLVGVFNNLDNLRRIDLSQNRITHADTSSFGRGLKYLHLSQNKITTFSKYVKNWDTNLELLDLSNNKLSDLKPEAFSDSLRELNLSHNLIRELNAKGFVLNKTRLKWIDLRFNQIRDLFPGSVATESATLPILYISDNPLVCSCNNYWLKGLLSKVPTTVTYPIVHQLELLKCTQPIQRDYPSVLISEVPKSEFLCSYLSHVYPPCPCKHLKNCDCVSRCPSQCRCYRDADSVEDVVDCRSWKNPNKPILLQKIPYYSTKWLLDGAAIQTNVTSFYRRSRLREVYLNNTGIRHLFPGSFKELKRLERVDLSDNMISELLDGTFDQLGNLTMLSFSRNKIHRIEDKAFSGMPNLKVLNLENNQLSTLPPAVIKLQTKSPTAFALGENPWKCDCGNVYKLQTWLPKFVSRVFDSQSIYCFEDLNDPANGTILSVMAPNGPNNTIRVNFWTFRAEINKTFCKPPPGQNERSIADDTSDSSGNEFGGLAEGTKPKPTDVLDKLKSRKRNLIILAVVIVAAALLTILITIGFCFFRRPIRSKLGSGTSSKKYYQAGSHEPLPPVNLSPVSSGNTSLYIPHPHPHAIPLLQYDAFLAYSVSDDDFVSKDIAPQLEADFPYYNLCLLYRDVIDPTYNANHLIDDVIFDTMAKCQRIILIITDSFLNNEWQLAQVRSALQFALRERRIRLVAIFTAELNLARIDPVLGQYLRTSVCITWGEQFFWGKLREALPDKITQNSLNETSSTAYYGTIVPSEFV